MFKETSNATNLRCQKEHSKSNLITTPSPPSPPCLDDSFLEKGGSKNESQLPTLDL